MTPAEVKSLRKAAGLTQQEAADLVGRELRTWQRWEEGRHPPDPLAIKFFRLKTRMIRKNKAADRL